MPPENPDVLHPAELDGKIAQKETDASVAKAPSRSGELPLFRASDLTPFHLVIDGKVYDVKEFSKTHPGGKALFTVGGADASDAFHTFHHGSKVSYAQLETPGLRVGVLAPGEKLPSQVIADKPFEVEARKLAKKFRDQGLFESRCAPLARNISSQCALAGNALLPLEWMEGNWS